MWTSDKIKFETLVVKGTLGPIDKNSILFSFLVFQIENLLVHIKRIKYGTHFKSASKIIISLC